jgi:DNA-directed RNA polymerase subunit L
VNSLRRLCIDHIPTYAACDKSITIDKNTSIFDNDYMRLRLSQLTIPDVKINIPYLEDKYWKNVDYGDPNRVRHPDDTDMIELYVNVTNNESTNLNVTTNHAKVYVNGETVNKFDEKYPLLLVQLKPKEMFSCRCVHALGIGKLSNLWAGGNIYYEEVNDNNYTMTLESLGQLDEYELLYKACIVMKEKVSLIRYKLQDFKRTGEYILIELWDEDSTMGELINVYLQDHELVQFAGVKKPNLLIDMMAITYVTTAKNPLDPFHEILDYVEELSEILLDKFDKLGDKYINFNKKVKSKK